MKKSCKKKAKDHISELMVWSWTFAECPKFSIELQNRFLWGTVDIGMTISNEVIQNFSIYTDSNEVEYFQELMSMLSGIRFDKKLVNAKLDNINAPSDSIENDIRGLINRLLP